MLARRHRDNAQLFGPSGGIILVTNQTDRAEQVPNTSVIPFRVHQGMSVIENFIWQDEELAPGDIMTRCSKTSCI